MSNIKKGDIVDVEITGIASFGIFVKLEDNYTGLIHISEIADKLIENISEEYSIGSIISAKVLDIDEEKLQVKLSIKRLVPSKKRKKTITEKGTGFKILEDNLDIWIENGLKSIKK